jgi:hypothetical protein
MHSEDYSPQINQLFSIWDTVLQHLYEMVTYSLKISIAESCDVDPMYVEWNKETVLRFC